jgi:K+-sensing histidine kinase KdpD
MNIMKNDPAPQEALSYDELLMQNQSLRNEIAKLSAQGSYDWNLFTETSLKLQVYTASIKAAVSSLLNYDIFWDSANQDEFLETIDRSVNQVSELIVLLTLAFRSQAGSLVLKKDKQVLQEILSVAQTNALRKRPDIRLEVSFPPEGNPAMVDYEYLTKALLLLYEIFFSRGFSEQIRVAASETNDCWVLDFTGIDSSIIDVINQMYHCKTQPAAIDFLSSENILKLHIACEILHLQEISVDVLDAPEQPQMLRLRVPVVKTM